MAWTHHRKQGPITFEAPFFEELLQGKENGRLPRDFAAHALWHYFCVASLAYNRLKTAIVYEGDPDPVFNARAIFEGLAMAHGVFPKDMGRYWEVVMQQRYALGLSMNADLPTKYMFKE